MEPCYPHIIKPYHFIAKNLSSQGSFLRHRNVTGSPGGYHDSADSVRHRLLTEYAYSGIIIVLQCVALSYHLSRLPGHAGNQYRLLAASLHDIDYAAYLLRGLSRAINHFRRALAYLAVQIHFGISNVLKGLHLYFEQCVLHGHPAGLHGFQYPLDFIVHPLTSRSSSTAL